MISNTKRSLHPDALTRNSIQNISSLYKSNGLFFFFRFTSSRYINKNVRALNIKKDKSITKLLPLTFLVLYNIQNVINIIIICKWNHGNTSRTLTPEKNPSIHGRNLVKYDKNICKQKLIVYFINQKEFLAVLIELFGQVNSYRTELFTSLVLTYI